ncbi:MAG: CBS domain-containing protein [Methanobacteriota archaeon]|nr:MAG: CBS domain-containing protein [Euryarchaeota archaeon]
MKLTTVQREILQALIDLHHTTRGAVQGKDIAEKLSRHPGTIRNQMVALRALGLVEGISGPRGGYFPRSEAFTALDMEELKEEVEVPIYLDKKPLEKVTVVGIELTSISDPKKCRALVHVKGTLQAVDIGDVITLGPTPVQRLVIRGKVLGRDDINNVLVINILEMLGIPKIKIKEITTTDVKTLRPETTVKDAAELISRGHFRGAPVVDGKKILGMVSTVDITKAVAEGKVDARVADVMSTTITTIKKDAPLIEAIELTEQNNVSRLIVVNNRGEIAGIVTRTDILSRLARLAEQYFL